MDQEVGSFDQLYRIGLNPSASDDPEDVRRGRAIATVQPAIQRVEGDAQTAERSFLKINANPATIDPTDLDVIRARRKPNAIAARALMRAGTDYFSKLMKATEIDTLAKEVHSIVFGPVLEINTQSPDVPRAGQPYSSDAFKMVLDMVNIFNSITPAMWQEQKRVGKNKTPVLLLQDDTDGSTTLGFLEKVKDVGTLVCDNGERNSGSLGLDQAVYSYGATGKFHPGAFLASLRLAQELEVQKKLKEFTKVRRNFEEFLVRHKFFINQIGHSKGSRTRPVEAMLQMHRTVIKCLQDGIRDDKKIIRKLRRDRQLEELQDVTNIPKDQTRQRRFSKAVQDAGVVRSTLENRERCKVCGARLPPACRSKDHVQRQADSGVGTLANLQFTHPYCNTGYKESQVAKGKKKRTKP